MSRNAQNDEIAAASQSGPGKPHKKENAAGMKQFLYNSETGEVMGRSALGWLKLLIFYLIFYGCLAGFFSMMLAIFFINISGTVPKYYNDDGLIKSSDRSKSTPGMGIRPMPDYETTLITFQANQAASYAEYTDHIRAFLKSYQHENQGQDSTRKTCTKTNGPNDVKGCTFKVEDKLGDCGQINTQSDMGYDAGTPCVIIKMNKIFGWVPEPYDCSKPEKNCGMTADQMKFFKSTGRPGVDVTQVFDGYNVPVTCEGINPADKENILGIEWHPSSYQGSFPSFYYPFLNQRNYIAPLVAARFNVTRGVLVMVRCRVWAKNIENTDFNSKEGAVHFELMVD